MRETLPGIGSRKALLLAIVFAAVVVVLSTIGPGLEALLFALLPLAGLFIVSYFVVRWAVAAGMLDAGGYGGTLTAREILDKRYARGEIGPEDHERRRSHLETP